MAPCGPHAGELCRALRFKDRRLLRVCRRAGPHADRAHAAAGRGGRFNIKRFDYRVLSAYTELDFSRIPTLDILEKVKDQLGYRLSLDHLASATLDAGKTADGLDALKWWREGKMARILEYCRSDVTITRDLYRFGLEKRLPAVSEQGQADRQVAGQLVTLP